MDEFGTDDVLYSGETKTDSVTFRVRSALPMSFEYTNTPDDLKKIINCQIKFLQDIIYSPQTIFYMDSSAILIKETLEAEIIKMTDETPCSKLYEYIQQEDEDSFTPSVKKRDKQNKIGNIQMKILFRISPVAGHNHVPKCVPLIHHELKSYQQVTLSLPLDVVVAVPESEPFGSLISIFRDKVCKQIHCMGSTLMNYRKGEKLSAPIPYHFKIPDIDQVITIIYPDGVDEKELETYRKYLHEKLSLPMDRPFIKRANSIVFPEDEISDGYLKNTHLGLPPSGVKDGKQYLVQGSYTYHHYMQDRFNDDKWGCAYRSLQTLVSWFRHQAYTDHHIPSHKDIQQALVDIGDKEASFVNSRKWIGSTEVGYCLDHMLGVSSKILFVSKGTEMPSKGRELAMHFQNQGTPIMIGGGVLAHTILGVDFNEVTGDVKFLILDPHYTGAEDLKVIHDKGWCGWKGPDFWDPHAYYNMCMPQRPIAI